jgi:hypothetical protein
MQIKPENKKSSIDVQPEAIFYNPVPETANKHASTLLSLRPANALPMRLQKYCSRCIAGHQLISADNRLTYIGGAGILIRTFPES